MFLDRKLRPAAGPLDSAIAAAGQIILGKQTEIKLSLACLVARGHLLIEDIPGVGKTTLSQLLAKLFGLQHARVQFTSDLLPGDVLGVSIFDRDSGAFRFQSGPIFTNVLLADEINRASPKAQSALLEAMEERQVTIDGSTRPLPEPFFVVATQNPAHQIGTFPLPESQLDRFLMRVSLGYPDRAAERALLAGEDRRALLAQMAPASNAAALATLQAQAVKTHVSPALLDYLQALVEHTRSSGRFALGLSPRAALAVLRAAQAWATVEGREFVLPEDIQSVLPATVNHRLHGVGDHARATFDAAQELIRAVPVG